MAPASFAPGEARAAQVGAREHRAFEIGLVEPRLAEAGVAKLGSGKVGARQVRLVEERAREVGTAEVRPFGVDPIEIGFDEVRAGEIGALQRTAEKGRLGKVCLAQIGTIEFGALELAVLEIAPGEIAGDARSRGAGEEGFDVVGEGARAHRRGDHEHRDEACARRLSHHPEDYVHRSAVALSPHRDGSKLYQAAGAFPRGAGVRGEAAASPSAGGLRLGKPSSHVMMAV